MKKKRSIGPPGIYKITNLINNKIYIGSCVGFNQRKGQHKYRLRKGNHDNSHLQSSWNKYGEDAFIFELIEEVENLNNLLEREQHYIDTLNVCDRIVGYNKAPIAGSCLGRKMSKESRAKMSKAKTGVKQSPEVAAKRGLLCRKAILQFDLNNNFIKEFDSVKTAADELGVCRTGISKALSINAIHAKTAYGYIWKYKDETKAVEQKDIAPYFIRKTIDYWYIKVKISTIKWKKLDFKFLTESECIKKVNTFQKIHTSNEFKIFKGQLYTKDIKNIDNTTKYKDFKFKRKTKAVILYTEDGETKNFNSIQECADYLGVLQHSVNRVLNGKRITIKNCKVKYKKKKI